MHYFGAVSDWQKSLQLFLDQKDDLYAGRRPRTNGDGTDVGNALDRFLSAKKLLESFGEISPRSFLDYVRTYDTIAEAIHPRRLVSDIDVSDLDG